MKNTFMNYKQNLDASIIFFIAVSFVYGFFQLGIDMVLVSLGLILIACFVFRIQIVREQTEAGTAISVFLKNIADGDLDRRILSPKGNSRQIEVANNLNYFLDQTEISVREMNKVFSSAAAGKSYRRPLPKMSGNYGRILDRMCKSSAAVADLQKSKKLKSVTAKLGDLRANKLLKLLKGNQSDLRFVTSELETVENDTQNLVSTSGKGKQEASNVVASMDALETTLVKMQNATQLLSEHTSQINEMVASIGGVADQTNLLALNAAIEAARAGEQGRGFAVVADEVRSLAETTKDTTSKIAEMVNGIVTSASEVVAGTDEMSRSTNRFSVVANQFDKDFSEFSDINLHTYERITKVRMLNLFNLIKQELIIFLQDGYRLLDAGLDCDEAKLLSQPIEETHLGSWLYGTGMKEYGHLPSFNKLLAPYQDIYDAYQHVIEIIVDQDWATKDNKLDDVLITFTKIEGMSNSFVDCVDALVEEKSYFESSSSSVIESDVELF